MLSAHHLSILQRRLLPLPPQIGKPMVQKKRKGTSPLGQMVLVTLIGNHLTFPIWKQVNLDQHTDYWPASLTRSIIGTLPQSWKGLNPPSPPLVQLLEAADWKIGRTRLLWLHSSSIYNTIQHCTVQIGSKHTYKHKIYTLRFPFQLCLIGPFCLKHLTKYRSTATLIYRRRLSGVVDKGLL